MLHCLTATISWPSLFTASLFRLLSLSLCTARLIRTTRLIILAPSTPPPCCLPTSFARLGRNKTLVHGDLWPRFALSARTINPKPSRAGPGGPAAEPTVRSELGIELGHAGAARVGTAAATRAREAETVEMEIGLGT